VLEQLDIERALNSGLGERRADTLENLWRNLERHLGEHRDVATLTLGELDDYEGKRRAESHRGRSTTGQTIRRERGAFVRGLRLAKRRGLLERYPFDLDDLGKVRSDPRDARQAGKLWSTEQINDVLEALSDKAKSAGYDRMLRLIQRTGLRLNEFRRCASFVRVKAPRGSGAHELLTIDEQHAKTRRARVVPLIRDDGDTIDELGNTFGTKKFNHALVLASAEAGLPGVLTPRDLRKWYLSTAAGSDVLAAQRLGGHSNVATTGLYLEAEIARAIRAGLGAARAATAEGGHTGGPQRKRTGGKAQ
jgi:integrase